jgi:hypothetical protein
MPLRLPSLCRESRAIFSQYSSAASSNRNRSGQRGARSLRPEIVTLEVRLLLSGDPLSSPLISDLPAIPGQTAQLYPWPLPDAEPTPRPDSAVLAAGSYGSDSQSSAAGVKHSPSAVPALNSLPGVRASLYLDFDGDFTASYGGYKNISTPAYDQDGDPTSFTDGELAAIRKVWSYVAEDYAPFNINVTTTPPASMAHGVTEKVVIGGNGSWTGGAYGGLTYVNDFTKSSIPNIAFVFSASLANGDPKFTGDAVSHEAGHGFGLNHQCLYSGTTLIAPYYSGSGDGTAPLMGNSYSARLSRWWYGPSEGSPTNIQDDMAIIASAKNGFGYRSSAGNGSAATATPLSVVNGSQVGGAGLIITTGDLNYYSFDSGSGVVSFTVSVPANVNNLAPRVFLLDATGTTVIASAGPSATDFSARITATLPAAGSYRLMVAGNGGYGNVGTYTVSGTIVPTSNSEPVTSPGLGAGSGVAILPPLAPSDLQATTVGSYRIDLRWEDVPGETGFQVERSVYGGSWVVVASTGAGVAGFSDVAVVPGAAYSYRVEAIGTSGLSAPSNVATASTPTSPFPPTAVTGLSAVVQGPNRVFLSWQSTSSNVQRYIIERSTNSRKWVTVAQLNAGTTSYVDSQVAPNANFYYRVRAANVYGLSPASRVVRVKTPRALVSRANLKRSVRPAKHVKPAAKVVR